MRAEGSFFGKESYAGNHLPMAGTSVPGLFCGNCQIRGLDFQIPHSLGWFGSGTAVDRYFDPYRKSFQKGRAALLCYGNPASGFRGGGSGCDCFCYVSAC